MQKVILDLQVLALEGRGGSQSLHEEQDLLQMIPGVGQGIFPV